MKPFWSLSTPSLHAASDVSGGGGCAAQYATDSGDAPRAASLQDESPQSKAWSPSLSQPSSHACRLLPSVCCGTHTFLHGVVSAQSVSSQSILPSRSLSLPSLQLASVFS